MPNLKEFKILDVMNYRENNGIRCFLVELTNEKLRLKREDLQTCLNKTVLVDASKIKDKFNYSDSDD